MSVTRWKLASASVAVLLGMVLAPAVANASPGSGWPHHMSGRGNGEGAGKTGTVVSIESSSMYGSVLVVGGSGAGYDPTSPGADAQGYLYPAGSSLYTATIDPNTFGDGLFGRPYRAGCNATTQAVSVLEENGDPAVMGPPYPPFTCAGTETDPTADWPALTTSGRPVAGPGVNQFLLGSVYRADLGTFQVTYAGRPLYLFDPGPNSFAGEDFFESVAPLFPWHTAWYLMSPDGQMNPGPATLETDSPVPGSTTYTSTVLANEMLPALGGVPVTVYSFTSDGPWFKFCLGPCSTDFLPVLTSGPPTAGPGVNASEMGSIKLPGGLSQVTYGGNPLYMYDQDMPVIGPFGPQTAGSGSGIHAFGGTFKVVNP